MFQARADLSRRWQIGRLPASGWPQQANSAHSRQLFGPAQPGRCDMASRRSLAL